MLNMLETEEGYDFICPDCKNYVMLEKNKLNKNMLEGKCALCGKNFSMLYEDWEKWDKKKYINEDEEVNLMDDYTAEYYYKYNGKNWLMLQNGENIVFAKRSALLRLDKDKYTLLYDSENKTKILTYDIPNVDVIFIKK